MIPASAQAVEDRFPGAGGVEIFTRTWPAADRGEPRAAIVLAHGASEHSGRYGHVAARLNEAGYAVFALDHRGHGRSAGPRALVDRMSNVVADLDTLVSRAAQAHPGTPVYLLGHSMGGCIAVSYVQSHQERLSGLILSGPLAALEAAPLPLRLLAALLSRFAPRAGVVSIDSGQVSRDPAVVQDYRDDPLNYHGKLPARTVVELARAIERFPDAVGSVSLPTLIVYGTADGLAPPAGSIMLSERLGSSDLTLIPYEGLYHEVFNEPEQARVLDDVVAWLDARVPAAGPAR